MWKSRRDIFSHTISVGYEATNYSEVASIKSYLYGIAKNVCRNDDIDTRNFETFLEIYFSASAPLGASYASPCHFPGFQRTPSIVFGRARRIRWVDWGYFGNLIFLISNFLKYNTFFQFSTSRTPTRTRSSRMTLTKKRGGLKSPSRLRKMRKKSGNLVYSLF